jgi:hypothetical protein
VTFYQAGSSFWSVALVPANRVHASIRCLDASWYHSVHSAIRCHRVGQMCSDCGADSSAKNFQRCQATACSAVRQEWRWQNQHIRVHQQGGTKPDGYVVRVQSVQCQLPVISEMATGFNLYKIQAAALSGRPSCSREESRVALCFLVRCTCYTGADTGNRNCIFCQCATRISQLSTLVAHCHHVPHRYCQSTCPFNTVVLLLLWPNYHVVKAAATTNMAAKSNQRACWQPASSSGHQPSPPFSSCPANVFPICACTSALKQRRSQNIFKPQQGLKHGKISPDATPSKPACPCPP